MKKLGLILGAASLVAMPVTATAQLARATAPVENENNAGGSSWILAAAAAAAAIGAIIIIVDDDDDDIPVSG